MLPFICALWSALATGPGDTENMRSTLNVRTATAPENADVLVFPASNPPVSLRANTQIGPLQLDKMIYDLSDGKRVLLIDAKPDGLPSVFPDYLSDDERNSKAWTSRQPSPEALDAVVRLVYSGGSKRQRVCTAVILSDHWLLTAAHCVVPRPTQFLLGAQVETAEIYNLSKAPGDCLVPPALATGAPRGGLACSAVPQDLLRNAVPRDDLALLRSATPLPTNVLRPYAGISSDDKLPLHGAGGLLAAGVRIVGYGATVIYNDDGTCRGAEGFAVERLAFNFAVESAERGELRLTGTAKVAPGDSGAPVLARIDSPWEQEVVVGVVGDSDCSGAQRAASILRADIRDWLTAVTGIAANLPKGYYQ